MVKMITISGVRLPASRVKALEKLPVGSVVTIRGERFRKVLGRRQQRPGRFELRRVATEVRAPTTRRVGPGEEVRLTTAGEPRVVPKRPIPEEQSLLIEGEKVPVSPGFARKIKEARVEVQQEQIRVVAPAPEMEFAPTPVGGLQKLGVSLREFERRSFLEVQRDPTSLAARGKQVGAFISGGARALLVAPAIAIAKPKEALVAGKEALKSLKEVGFKETFEIKPGESPAAFAGATLGLVAGPRAIGKVTKAVRIKAVKVGAREVSPEFIFDPKVLSGEAAFPTAVTGAEALRAFKATKFEVLSTGPAQLPAVKVVAGTPRGASPAGGLFTTPTGRGSPFFARVTDAPAIFQEPKISLLPRLPKTPTAVRIQLEKVSRLPPAIRTQIAPATEFIVEKAGRAEAFISPGFERFAAGLKKPGTPELEAIIAPGTVIRRVTPKRGLVQRAKGFEEFTILERDVVTLPRFEVVKGRKVGKPKKPLGEITFEELGREVRRRQAPPPSRSVLADISRSLVPVVRRVAPAPTRKVARVARAEPVRRAFPTARELSRIVLPPGSQLRTLPPKRVARAPPITRAGRPGVPTRVTPVLPSLISQRFPAPPILRRKGKLKDIFPELQFGRQITRRVPSIVAIEFKVPAVKPEKVADFTGLEVIGI